jgi:hypothetical protein
MKGIAVLMKKNALGRISNAPYSTRGALVMDIRSRANSGSRIYAALFRFLVTTTSASACSQSSNA